MGSRFLTVGLQYGLERMATTSRRPACCGDSLDSQRNVFPPLARTATIADFDDDLHCRCSLPPVVLYSVFASVPWYLMSLPANPSTSTNMRLRKQSSAEMMRRRSLRIILTFSNIFNFGGSADPSVQVAVATAAAAEETPVPPDQQHRDLKERYLQAISEADGERADVVNGCFFVEADTFCQESSSFVSVMGANCAIHHRFDCTLLNIIGYTEQEVYDVINNCPCACKVPCGQWTFTPSAEPSSSPSSRPSASPRCGTFDIYTSTSSNLF